MGRRRRTHSMAALLACLALTLATSRVRAQATSEGSVGAPATAEAEPDATPDDAVEREATEADPDVQAEASAAQVAADAATADASAEAGTGTGDPTPAGPPGLPEDASSWEPPTNTKENWDWVLLTTGEWLKGTIDAVRDGDMEIDSDQFGDLVVDMDDVAAIYAYRVHTYQLEDRTAISGIGVLRGKEFTIDGVPMPTDSFMGMVDGPPRERNYWSMKLNLSLAMRNGNTDQTTLSDTLFVRRDAASTRFTFDTYGSIGQSDDAINVQNQTGTAQFDVFLSKVFYLTPILGGFTHDRFQNIDIRAVPASGFGFHAIDSSDVSWDLEAAAGYLYTNYRGEKEGNHDGVVRFATRFDADVGDPLDIVLSWNTNLVVSDLGRTFHHGQLSLELEITDAVDTTIGVIFDRVEQPQGFDGQPAPPPKKNDIQLNFGVQLELG